MSAAVLFPDIGQPRPRPEVRTFSNKTLQGNWYEDRWGEPEELRWNDRMARLRPYEPEISIGLPMSSQHYPAAHLPHYIHFNEPQSWRTQTVDFPKDPAVPYIREDRIQTSTTKKEMDSHLHQKLHPRRNPAMINHLNMRNTIWADRRTDAPEGGFGATLPRHSDEELKGDWKTTAQEFYEDKPAVARTTRPDIYCQPVNKQCCSTGKLARDTFDKTKNEDKYAGRAGRRGELVRHPGEAGSVYGMSTFVDEYAKWGTKLEGVKLGDTLARKTTRYFDA